MTRDPAWFHPTWDDWRFLFWWFRNRPTVLSLPTRHQDRLRERARPWPARQDAAAREDLQLAVDRLR